MTFSVHQGELHRPDVRDLLALHVSAMRAHSPPDACHVLPSEGLDRSDISLFSLREEGRLLGIGALRMLSVSEGEIKSMRTAPDSLRRGVGAAILQAIVSEARARGYRRLRLETGRTADFAPAVALYEKAGFVAGEPFGGYAPGPFTRFFRLDL
jgi:putative acetyltransferase